MKGIKCCAECADYSLKKHKCTRGAKDPGKATDSFYADCPLDDAQPLRHGRWIERQMDLICSVCKWEYSDELRFMSNHGLDSMTESFAYCPHCGADMREGGAENG